MCLYDTVEQQLVNAVDNIKELLCDLQQKGLLEKSPVTSAEEAIKLVSTTSDLQEAMKDAFFLQVRLFFVITSPIDIVYYDYKYSY